MREGMGKILGAMLRSLFVFTVMFVIGFSLISGEFPPNFGHMEKTYQSFRQMTQISSKQTETRQISPIRQDNPQGDSIEKDIERLELLNLKRAELGESILIGRGSRFVQNPANIDTRFLEEKDLKERVADLQTQIYRLQQRLSQLEDKIK